jgi:predicted nucleotidyltransferase
MQHSKTSLDLSDEDLKIVYGIIKKYIPDKTVWAFGSRVTGKAKKFSDLDLVIVNEEELDFNLYVELKNAFDESDLPIKVDIVEWVHLSDSFKKIISSCYYKMND